MLSWTYFVFWHLITLLKWSKSYLWHSPLLPYKEEDRSVCNSDVLIASLLTHPKGSYCEIVWCKAAILLINTELHQSCLKIFISEDKSWIVPTGEFPLFSQGYNHSFQFYLLNMPPYLLQWHYCMHWNQWLKAVSPIDRAECIIL